MKQNYTVMDRHRKHLRKVDGRWVVAGSASEATVVTCDAARNHDRIFGKGYRLVFHSTTNQVDA
jgi:hypothetical protein